jgi:REP element-mobilizing transposase RayT
VDYGRGKGWGRAITRYRTIGQLSATPASLVDKVVARVPALHAGGVNVRRRAVEAASRRHALERRADFKPSLEGWSSLPCGMASTLTRLLVRVTFSTKGREALIPVEVEADLYAYLGGICRWAESPLLAMGGTADHVHLLVSLSKAVSLAEMLMAFKRDTSKWLKACARPVPGFAWRAGYFAFSIGESGVAALRRYIASQNEHHRTIGFMDEVPLFLRELSGGGVAEPTPRPGYGRSALRAEERRGPTSLRRGGIGGWGRL